MGGLDLDDQTLQEKEVEENGCSFNTYRARLCVFSSGLFLTVSPSGRWED